ncbi:MAG TPA: T9SS type A sorting domain-containing protein [Puia sp.]|nr:T9SS type A sorting domain-containing protein [Puia sp.]
MKRITFVLQVLSLLILLPGMQAHAQINAYARVTAVAGTTLTLSNANQTYHTFAAGEQIIVMQMQDTVIGADTANNSSFGVISSIVNAGKYEVATISSVAGMPTSMILTGGLANTYNTNPNARVQIISFNTLSTTNYTTVANITGVAWNGNVGGVVAFQVGGTLTLANSVSADGLGFRGGAVSSNYEVSCEPNVYDITSTNYAYKGEGIYASPTISYTTHMGRAPLLNGGGGGSDDNGGGGGGGNYTAGGQGGQGWTCTAANASGGLGGVSLGSYMTGSRIFMGGGGGGGQQNNSVGTAGAAGGGIVLIKANILTTSCAGSVNISAAGLAAGTSGNDGAGGGGAGGTIVLNVNTFSVPAACPLTVQANAGNGGNVGNTNAHGGGGGGGQGAIIYSASIPTTNVTSTANNGTGGLNSSSGGATSAGNGSGTNNSGIVLTSTILPVNFISFTAGKNEKDVMLNWITGTAAYQYISFNVQRSTDGLSFQTIGTVNGIVDAASENVYSFTDGNPGAGNNFYRISAIGLSGGQVYSTIVSIDFSGSANTFNLFPNPSNGQFSIRVQDAGDKLFSLSIEDLAGRTVYAHAFQSTGNLIAVAIGKSLAPGIYVVRLKGNGPDRAGKLIIK